MYIFDLHQDISDSMLYTAHGDFWKKNDLRDGWNDFSLPVNNQSDFVRLGESGFKAIFGACCAIEITKEGKVAPCKDHRAEVERHFALYHQLVEEGQGKVQFILRRDDLAKIKDHALSFLLAVEGADSIDDELAVVDWYAARGVRSVGFTWNYNNRLAGGCMEDGRLSDTGRRAITRMEEHGIVLDLAHINEASFWDCMEVAKKPVIISHTACRVCFDSPRNVSDEQMLAVKKTGGTIGIFGVPKYLGAPTVEKIIEHIRHCVGVVGIDHVSFGTDFGSMTAPQLIPGFEHVSDMPSFIDRMRESGFSEEDLEKIGHKNIERVLWQTLPT